MGKIAIVADELSDIAEEVKLMASLYDFVYTTGGIGPTHDDVTLEGESVWLSSSHLDVRRSVS